MHEFVKYRALQRTQWRTDFVPDAEQDSRRTFLVLWIAPGLEAAILAIKDSRRETGPVLPVPCRD
jgi:hypothetical protein